MSARCTDIKAVVNTSGYHLHIHHIHTVRAGLTGNVGIWFNGCDISDILMLEKSMSLLTVTLDGQQLSRLEQVVVDNDAGGALKLVLVN